MAFPVHLTSDGLRLSGEYHVPSSAGPHPGLCIFHGIPAVPYNPEDTGYHDLAVRFSEAGFATLLVSLRGAGKSEGDFDMPGWTRDIGASFDFLSTMKGVDASRLYLMGFSGGAAAGICRAASDARIAAVVSCASPAHFDDLLAGEALDSCLTRWREIGIIRDPAFPRDVNEWAVGFRRVAPVDHVSLISPRPLLLLHGDADDVVPVAQARQLFDAAGKPRELTILPGGVHRLRVDERAMATALDWLRARASG